MIEIALAGAPMGKERVRVTRAGHAYTPERTLTYEARLAHRAQDVIGTRPLIEGPLKLQVVTLMPIPESKAAKWKTAAIDGLERPTKKPDWDNFGKILDALNLVVWTDDAQVVDGRVQKFFWSRPAMIIRVERLAIAERPPEWALRHVSDLTADADGVFG